MHVVLFASSLEFGPGPHLDYSNVLGTSPEFDPTLAELSWRRRRNGEFIGLRFRHEGLGDRWRRVHRRGHRNRPGAGRSHPGSPGLAGQRARGVRPEPASSTGVTSPTGHCSACRTGRMLRAAHTGESGFRVVARARPALTCPSQVSSTVASRARCGLGSGTGRAASSAPACCGEARGLIHRRWTL